MWLGWHEVPIFVFYAHKWWSIGIAPARLDINSVSEWQTKESYISYAVSVQYIKYVIYVMYVPGLSWGNGSCPSSSSESPKAVNAVVSVMWKLCFYVTICNLYVAICSLYVAVCRPRAPFPCEDPHPRPGRVSVCQICRNLSNMHNMSQYVSLHCLNAQEGWE
jgi:hypothetical protein